ncbi:MAG TPA: hypothetical protein PL041_08455 [Melioribacteraceae bacterium]|nr:hypothetical protein [Melioribacteraceae bacterium]
MNKKFLLSIIFTQVLFLNINAQTCGFGCLGLSGAYAGYTFQSVNLDDFNKALLQNDDKFGSLKGFRFGVNLFRAQFDDFFLSLKGFYQILEQEKSGSTNIEFYGRYNYNRQVKLNHFGAGIDFGIPFSDLLDFKIIEAGLTFFDASYVDKISGDNTTEELKFTNSGTDMGYYIGTGFILNLVKNYASLEGSFFYSYVKVSKMLSDNGANLLDKSDFINAGDIGFTLQINIGIPF